MSDDKPSELAPGGATDIKRSRDFWLYGADNPKSIKAERNLSQLAEWDDRLAPAARKVPIDRLRLLLTDCTKYLTDHREVLSTPHERMLRQ